MLKFRVGGQINIRIFKRPLYLPQKTKNPHKLQSVRILFIVHCSLFTVVVPGAGIEPARVLPHWFLRPTRLPVPPSGQMQLTVSSEQSTVKNCALCSVLRAPKRKLILVISYLFVWLFIFRKKSFLKYYQSKYSYRNTRIRYIKHRSEEDKFFILPYRKP
jgi:hypothetical protein